MKPNFNACRGFHEIRRSVTDALPGDLYQLAYGVEDHTVRDSWTTHMVESTAIIRAFRLPQGDIRNHVTRPHPALREFLGAAHSGTAR